MRRLSPVLDTTVLVNTTKSRGGDSYNDYRGNSLWETLQAVGVAETASAVDVLSADGYEHTFTFEELRPVWPQAAPVMGLGKQDLGACGWVTYASRRLEAGQVLPSVPVLLAFEENGQALERARFDAATGRLVGKGPLRVIVPQFRGSRRLTCRSLPTGRARRRWRSRTASTTTTTTTAARAAYAIVAVRVRPLPKGTRDIDWQSAASRVLAAEPVVFFGALKSRD